MCKGIRAHIMPYLVGNHVSLGAIPGGIIASLKVVEKNQTRGLLWLQIQRILETRAPKYAIRLFSIGLERFSTHPFPDPPRCRTPAPVSIRKEKLWSLQRQALSALRRQVRKPSRRSNPHHREQRPLAESQHLSSTRTIWKSNGGSRSGPAFAHTRPKSARAWSRSSALIY